MHFPMNHTSLHDPSRDTYAPRRPDWLARLPYETPEDVGFSSGAALALLDMAQKNPSLPAALWRARFALTAGAHCAQLSGRREGESALRDILCLLRPGEQAGPAGEIAFAWNGAAAHALSEANLIRVVSEISALEISVWDKPSQNAPVAQAAGLLEAVLTDAPRAHSAALILADAALARAMGWRNLIPILGCALPRHDLTARGDDLRLACHRAIVKSVAPALSLATELSRRAAHLQQVAPKLRSKQAAQAVDMFLTRDAIAPAALTALMSDRAARRFCDRLVSLGAVRELTGRDTFRLYGL